MRFESEPLQMNAEGKLGPVKEICVVAAEKTLINSSHTLGWKEIWFSAALENDPSNG